MTAWFGSGPGSSPAVHLEPLPGIGDLAPVDVAGQLRDLPGLVLLESARSGPNARWSYLTADPLAVLASPSAGPDPFADSRRLLAQLAQEPAGTLPFAGGLVGFLGYDLGRRLERPPARAAADQDLPDLHLALHDWVLAWDHHAGGAWLAGRALDGDVGRLASRLSEIRARLAGLSGGGASAARVPAGWRPGSGLMTAASQHEPPFTARGGGGYPTLRFVSGLDRAAYQAAVQSLRGAIADGQLYQANLSRRLVTAFDGDPWPLYRRLRSGDPARFAAYVTLGRSPAGGGLRALISASPEPFLAVTRSGHVSTNPIKGTRSRGLDADEERELARELLSSSKDCAENVMIVDVLRNDLGRVCRPGSIGVPRLGRLERAGAVQHLVSTVTGRLRPDCDAFDLLAACFPGGSITGAPKIRAMELIEALEPVRRGPYTGTAGWVGPDGAMRTSVLIRTLVADGRRLTLHVGGGITWRSDPALEWAETQAKARGPLSAIGGFEVAG